MAARRRCPATITTPTGTRPCPQLTPPTARYCPTHAREYEARRGSTTARGYDATHQAEHKAWAARIAAGEHVTCPRCGKCITDPNAFDLGHPTGRSGGRKPECKSCNRSEGGRRGRAAQT